MPLPLCPLRRAAQPPSWALLLPPRSLQWILCLLDPTATYFLSFLSRFCRAHPSELPKKVCVAGQFLEPVQVCRCVYSAPTLNWPGCHFIVWRENSRLKAFSLRHLKTLLHHLLASRLAFEKSHNIMISSSLYMTIFFFFSSDLLGALLYPWWCEILQSCVLASGSFFICPAGHLVGLFNLKLIFFSSWNLLTTCLIISYLLFFLVSGILFYQSLDRLRSPAFHLLTFPAL